MEATVADAPRGKKFEDYELDEPIVRGETTIATVTVRKPKPGECRGLKLNAIANGDVDALIKLIPRITTPAISEQEIADETLSLQDFTEIAGIIVDFLYTKARRAGLPTT